MKRKNSHLRIFRHPSEGRKYAASNQEAKEPKSEKKERELLPSSSLPDAESQGTVCAKPIAVFRLALGQLVLSLYNTKERIR